MVVESWKLQTRYPRLRSERPEKTNCMALSYIFEDVHKARSSRTETEVARCSPKGWGNIFFIVGSLNLFAGVTAALLPTYSSIALLMS